MKQYYFDTGVQANILSMKDYYALKQRPKLKKRETNLTSYNNDNISTVGICRARVKYNNITYNIRTDWIGQEKPECTGTYSDQRITDNKPCIQRTWMSVRQTPHTTKRKCCPRPLQ